MTRMIRIFDTTLRDGEQSPGASMNVEEKIMVAKQLARLGVDIIEAGFAYSSPGILKRCGESRRKSKGPTICSLARGASGGYRSSLGGIEGAPKVRIHTFLSTSDIHLKHQFRMTRDEAKSARSRWCNGRGVMWTMWSFRPWMPVAPILPISMR